MGSIVWQIARKTLCKIIPKVTIFAVPYSSQDCIITLSRVGLRCRECDSRLRRLRRPTRLKVMFYTARAEKRVIFGVSLQIILARFFGVKNFKHLNCFFAAHFWR